VLNRQKTLYNTKAGVAFLHNNLCFCAANHAEKYAALGFLVLARSSSCIGQFPRDVSCDAVLRTFAKESNDGAGT